MPRAVWKGPYFKLSLLHAIRQDVKKEGVKTCERSSMIIPAMVGAKLLVHNGKDYIPVNVREDMVGMRVGDFAATKKPFSYRATNAHKRTG